VLIQDLAGFVKAQTLDKKITIADEIVYVGYYLGLVKD
jgi:hypothetical protein